MAEELEQRLEAEVEAYNALVEKLAQLEREREQRFGRITVLQELVQEASTRATGDTSADTP